MSDWKKITLADLEMLPVGHRQKIPEDYLDANNHMNVMWCRCLGIGKNELPGNEFRRIF
jgi:hypothetical protein